jgi:hypothetical protein
MKKTIITLVSGLTLAASLAACGGPTGSTNSTESVPPVEPVTKSSAAPTTEAPKPAVAKSERGNTIKKVGEPAFWRADGLEDGAEVGRFTVTKIAPIACTEEYAQKPENGNLVALTIDVVTKPTLAQETVKSVYLSPFDFKYIAPNGTTFNGNLASAATYGCIDNSLSLKSEFGPAEKAHGIMVLDLPQKGGILTVGQVEWKLP